MSNLQILNTGTLCKKTDFQDLLKQIPEFRQVEHDIHKKIEKLFDGDKKLKETYQKVEDAQTALNKALAEAEQQQNKILQSTEGQKYLQELHLAQDRCRNMQYKLYEALQDEFDNINQQKDDEVTKREKKNLLLKAGVEASFGQNIAKQLARIFEGTSSSTIVLELTN